MRTEEALLENSTSLSQWSQFGSQKWQFLQLNGKSLNKTLKLWSWLFAFPSAQRAKAKRLRLCSINHVQVLRTYLNTTELLLGQDYRASSEIPSVVRTGVKLVWSAVKVGTLLMDLIGSGKVRQGVKIPRGWVRHGPTWWDQGLCVDADGAGHVTAFLVPLVPHECFVQDARIYGSMIQWYSVMMI